MTINGPLTEQELEQLRTQGYLKLRVFSAEDAAQMEAVIWHRLKKDNVLPDAPSTWGKYPGGLSRSVRNARLFRDAMTAEYAAVVDQLLGPGQWHPPKDRGTLLYTFPEDQERWNVTNKAWHWHGDPLRNVDQLRDIFIFTFLNKVEPEGGGTVIVEGSHHVVCKFYNELNSEQRKTKVKDLKRKLYASHPWLRDLTRGETSQDRKQQFMEESTDVFGFPLRVVELTGEPGEAYITNMSTMHARSCNSLAQPRFMTAHGINQMEESYNGEKTD